MVAGFRFRLVLIALLMVAGILTGTSPAAAELGDNNNLPWGVDGTDLPDGSRRIQTEVWAIEQIGNRIFVGGRFQEVTDGQVSIPQPYLAAFSQSSGQYITSFTPQFDGAVYSLAASPDGARLFVGGEFDVVNGQPIDGLVALDPNTGAVDAGWTGNVNGAPVIRSLDIVGSWLYVAGSFTSVVSSTGNNSASRVLRFDVTTGGHDPSWRPVVTGGSIWGVAASSDADRVYIAGYFKEVNGTPVVGGFAALEASTPVLATGVEDLQVNTGSTSRQYLYDVVVANGLVWVAGSQHFVQVLNETDLSLEKFHLAHPRGDFQDLEIVGDRVYAGCHCRTSAVMKSANGVLWFGQPPSGEEDAPVIAEGSTTWVSAFDAFTGDWIPTFRPQIQAATAGVWAIHGDPNDCVWFGGDLTYAGSSSVDGIVRLCEAGTVDIERPSVPGRVMVDQVNPDSVDLSWAPSTDDVGVVGYLIFDTASNAVLAEVPSASATLGSLAPATYSVYAKAVDAAGNRSYRTGFTSFTVTGEVVDTQRPSVPGALIVGTVGPDSVSFSWSPATDNVAVTGYLIFDAETNTVFAETAETSITLEGLAPQVYRFYARAVDAAGNRSYRTGIRTVAIEGDNDTERPSVPGALVVDDISGSTVALSWGQSTDNVGVVGYRIFDFADRQVVIETMTNAGTFDLVPGTYQLYAKAFDAAGNESYRTGLRTITVG